MPFDTTAPAALEVPVDSIESVREVAHIADRLELCADLASEGWTPPAELVRQTREVVGDRATARCGLVAMIRPRLRGMVEAPVLASFVTTERAMDQSLRDIDEVARAGADEVAIGLLREDATVDVEATGRLAAHARGQGLGVAFLRTIDLVHNRERAMHDVVDLGMIRVVTAGVYGWDAAAASVEARVAQLLADALAGSARAQATGGRSVTIVPGGGVRSSNARQFMRVSSDQHSSCRVGGVIDAPEASALRRALAADA